MVKSPLNGNTCCVWEEEFAHESADSWQVQCAHKKLLPKLLEQLNNWLVQKYCINIPTAYIHI